MLGEALASAEICALPELPDAGDRARDRRSGSAAVLDLGLDSNRKPAFPDHMESRDREALNINKLEQARIEKAGQLFRDLL